GIVGGMMTSGHVNPILGYTSPTTIYHEVVQLLEEGYENEERIKTRNGWEVRVNIEEAKLLLMDFLIDNGVEVYLHTPVVDVVKKDDRLVGLIVGTQQGPSLIRSKVFVDATGDGFVAAQAGAPFVQGRKQDGLCQPVSIEFTLEGVDETQAITCFGGSDPVKLPNGKSYSEFCKEAHDRGELPQNVSIVRLHRTYFKGERHVNATQVNNVNPLIATEVALADMAARKQIPQIVEFLKRNIPGYEQCRVKSSASTLGVRETRRIMGHYVLSDEDVEKGSRFEDVVVHKAWFLIDIHNPSGGGQAEGRSKIAEPYDIPLRCLIPQNVEGLLLAGRCISGTHRAHASYRVMGIALAVGQAAGLAAALCAEKEVLPSRLDYRDLQKELQACGVELFEK
ncbi:MAG: FAD-dependent oxidoreductase, partial [Clostridiaceae bacterium]|nr:FAD-dependent oxidoreductase [Clostridiaceae bacterium]